MKLIADNLRITRPDIRRALQRLDPEPVQALVKSCEARGAWADGIVQARHVLEVIRTLPDLLGFSVRTIGGISNLGTNAPDKRARLVVEQSYLSMLAAAGLDYALLDMLNPDLVLAANVSGILAKENIFSWRMVPFPKEKK
ncbi:MAG: hypothetical protein K9K63_13540 [Desulfotignum sp.]|nr:hypothetical protein [Desulfotignum sp.]MCF8138324.1 hypothetical protein [Desulfotignum sp.]